MTRAFSILFRHEIVLDQVRARAPSRERHAEECQALAGFLVAAIGRHFREAR